MTEPKLPDEAKAIANELAALARKYKLRELRGQFGFSYHDDVKWFPDIHFSWSHGRHGADERSINLTSELRETVQASSD